jgi:hypothetical protein
VDSSPGKLLFGLETEFGFSAIDTRTGAPDSQQALDALLEYCSVNLPHLRGTDAAVRMYLANGGLLYPDVGHPEYATAECHSPIAALQSLRAGEKILAEAAGQLDSSGEFENITLYRTNVDYSAISTTWGCHESYLSRRSPSSYAEQVLPHLVSRVVFTGSGGFKNRQPGAEFTLSPRVFHLNVPILTERSGNRAIFSLRNEPLCGGNFHRVHLICGESNYSDLSNYLKIGTTALVLAMADAGIEFEPAKTGVSWALQGMKRFAMDPDCKKKTPNGEEQCYTAIEIQRHYLEAAQRHLHDSFMPEWAEDVTTTWRRTLDGLETDPNGLAGSLDWPTKLAVYKQYVRDCSPINWDSLPVWSDVASQLSQAMANEQEAWPRVNNHQARLLRDVKVGDMGRLMKRLTRTLGKNGLDWSDLDAFQQLRDELCELDIRYGQLYPQGIFLDLQQAGEIEHRMVDACQVDAAINKAPEPGRARVRGDWVRRLSARRDKYTCSWTGIIGLKKQLDLCDPFVTKAKWEKIQCPPNPTRPQVRRRGLHFIDRVLDEEASRDQGPE